MYKMFGSNTVCGNKSFLSKESDTKILQRKYLAYDVGIISSYSNRINLEVKNVWRYFIFYC